MPRLSYVLFAGRSARSGCGDNDSVSTPTSPEFAPGSNRVRAIDCQKPGELRLLDQCQQAGGKWATCRRFRMEGHEPLRRQTPASTSSRSSRRTGPSRPRGRLRLRKCGPYLPGGGDHRPADQISRGALGPKRGVRGTRRVRDRRRGSCEKVDGAWGLEPPLDLSGEGNPVRLTFGIRSPTSVRFNPGSNPVNKRLLAYGAPAANPDRSEEYYPTRNWSATFSTGQRSRRPPSEPGVVVSVSPDR